MKPSISKALITGETVNESPDMPGAPGREPSGNTGRSYPRGPGRRGGPPGEMGGELQGKFSPRERQAFKELAILDLLNALGGDQFYSTIANMALKGEDPDPSMIQHFMDEAPKYASQMSPELNELMGKLFSMPK
jgi:hypothetical protein